MWLWFVGILVCLAVILVTCVHKTQRTKEPKDQRAKEIKPVVQPAESKPSKHIVKSDTETPLMLDNLSQRDDYLPSEGPSTSALGEVFGSSLG